jgi:hypothetical protein
MTLMVGSFAATHVRAVVDRAAVGGGGPGGDRPRRQLLRDAAERRRDHRLPRADLAHRVADRAPGSYFVFALGALLTAIVMFTLVRSTNGVLVAAPIAGFFMLGGFGVFAVYLPELFPTAVRATGQGFCFNFARVITGVGTVTTGYLVGRAGVVPDGGADRLAGVRDRPVHDLDRAGDADVGVA